MWNANLKNNVLFASIHFQQLFVHFSFVLLHLYEIVKLLARRSAFLWSSPCQPTISKATKPIAANTPTYLMPPPSTFLSFLACHTISLRGLVLKVMVHGWHGINMKLQLLTFFIMEWVSKICRKHLQNHNHRCGLVSNLY